MTLPPARSRAKVGTAILATVLAILGAGQVAAASTQHHSVQEARR